MGVASLRIGSGIAELLASTSRRWVCRTRSTARRGGLGGRRSRTWSCATKSAATTGRGNAQEQELEDETMAAVTTTSTCVLAGISRLPRCSSAEFAAPCRPSLPFLSPCVAAFLSFSSPSSVRRLTPAPAFGSAAQTITSGVEVGEEEEEVEEEGEEDDALDRQVIVPKSAGFQPLGNKEKKELRAYAHGLGTRLNVQQVGKLGVSQSVVNSISDALEANEILKVKVQENCSIDMTDVITKLERGTGGQVVGKIGRTLLLYRASLRKLAASEKPPERRKRRSKIAMSAGRGTKMRVVLPNFHISSKIQILKGVFAKGVPISIKDKIFWQCKWHDCPT